MPAPVTFVDIAGIVKGASEGAGLGNKFLANIRECDAICQVVRVFADDDVVHVDGKVDPASDIEVIETELILADMQTLEKAVPRLEKEARNNKDRKPVHEAAVAAQASARQRQDAVLGGHRHLAVAGAEPDDHQAVPVRLQRRRVGAHRRGPQGRAACHGGARRRGVPRRQDRGRAAGARRRVRGRAARVDRPDRTRAGCVGAGRFSHVEVADVSDRRARRSPGPGPSTRATLRPRRRASSTPISRRASSRPRSCRSTIWSRPARWPPPSLRARSASRARTT